MDELLEFISTYGLGWVTLFAVVGIAMLGIMKKCNLFKKVDEKYRHYLYLAISIGFSVVATLVYLLIIDQFAWSVFLGIAVAVITLNQTFYNVFKVTPINELLGKLFDLLKALATKSKASEESAESTGNSDEESTEE